MVGVLVDGRGVLVGGRARSTSRWPSINVRNNCS